MNDISKSDVVLILICAVVEADALGASDIPAGTSDEVRQSLALRSEIHRREARALRAALECVREHMGE